MPRKKIVLRVNVTIRIEPDGDAFYAHCPGLKGLHTYGATEREALKNARAAVAAYLASLVRHGEPIPCSQVVKEKERERGNCVSTNISLPELQFA